MAKKIDPKAKAKKQKIYAAIGGVLLLGLLAFQVPRTMKMLHPPNVNDAATTPAATTPATGPIAAPSLGGGNASAVSATPAGGIADPDAVPLPQSGQLLAFGRFRTKDPFAQQLQSDCATGSPCSSPTAPGTGTGTPTTAAPATGSGSTSSGGGSSTSRSAAVISVNGSSQSVKVGHQFPTSDPAFTLISLTGTTAKIGIAGGSFANGTPTVSLKKTKPLTLMNTADGTRYTLRLLSVG